MTDEHDNDRDELRDQLAALFDRSDAAPRDVVPSEGLTLDDIRRADQLMNTQVTGTIPGEVVTDVDGVPIGVGPSQTVTSEFGGMVISQADVDRLGINPDDHPSIVGVWPPNRQEKHP